MATKSIWTVKSHLKKMHERHCIGSQNIKEKYIHVKENTTFKQTISWKPSYIQYKSLKHHLKSLKQTKTVS